MKMKVIGKLTLRGKVTLRAFDPLTGELVCEVIADNLVVTDGLEIAGSLLITEDGDGIGLTYCAIGTDATAPVAGDDKLKVEVARKAITTRKRVGVVVTLSTFFLASESNYNIKECGVFGRVGATSAANSGKLFARALLAYDNSAGNVDLTINWEITVATS